MSDEDNPEYQAALSGFTESLAWTSDHPIALTVDYASGSHIVLKDGRRVVDLISGIAVSSLGHGHPAVIEAIKRQVDKHLHVMVYGEFVLEPQAILAKELTACLPDGLDRVFFTSSGTEAVEGALKLAKKYTGRSGLVSFHNSYHGDTHGSLSVTGRQVYRDPFEPLLSDVTFVPFGDLSALSEVSADAACVIVEPIQGEGGVIVPDAAWHRALRARCSEVGALLIYDEIQTGFGRTGKMFAFDYFGTQPDILCLAKAMGGGMPLGGFVASEKTMRSLRHDPPLNHVTTFGGHPVSCAAGLAALRVLQKTDLPGRAPEIETRVRRGLTGEGIIEVRGVGAMLGLELASSDLAQEVVERCLANDVLLGWTLHSNSLIRIAPPLNIPFDILDKSINIISDSVAAALNS